MHKKKGLIIGILVITLIILGAFALQYYYWNIEPIQEPPMEPEENLSEPITQPPVIDVHTEPELSLYEQCLQDAINISRECRAFQTKNITLCENEDEGRELWCKTRLTKDRKYCDEIGMEYWDYHNCLLDTAETVEDCEAIDYTNEPYEINECMAYVTRDISYCDNLPEKDQKDCKANMQDDPALCEDNPNWDRKWNCLWVNSKDQNICNRYVQEFCRHVEAGDGDAYEPTIEERYIVNFE